MPAPFISCHCRPETKALRMPTPLRGYLAAIAIFCNEVKGKSALALSRDLCVSYKCAFVLLHKLREAMAEEMKRHWREDHRRISNGEQAHMVSGLAMKRGPSVDFCGYWQRGLGKNNLL
jgi:hypothetical protein